MEFRELDPDDAALDELYPVMAELRTDLSREAFDERYRAGHPDGYRLVGVWDDARCVAAAGYRVLTNFVRGRVMYVDDLVTSEQVRSAGYGKALNDYLMDRARQQGCDFITLDSGTRRTQAHRFYLREGYEITSFHFRRPL